MAEGGVGGKTGAKSVGKCNKEKLKLFCCYTPRTARAFR